MRGCGWLAAGMMQPQEFSSSPYTESCLVIGVLGVQVQGLMEMV
jgi:hypothetical protein